MIKLFLKIILGFILLLVLLVGSLFIPGVANLLGVSEFVSNQIEALANDFLNPKLDLGQISYRFPTTAVLTDVTLTQDETTILSIKRAVISLEQLPISSEQVRFSGFNLTDPVLRLVVDDKGDLLGWGDLIKDDDADSDSDRDDRASDHFAVDQIRMTNATIEYQDQRLKADTMRIDGFNLEIDAKKCDPDDPASENGSDDSAATPTPAKSAPPASGGLQAPNPNDPKIPTGPGWYRINTKIDREPILEITLDMAMDIDTLELVFKYAALNTTLKPENYHVLPPQLQEFVSAYAITGDFAAHTSGYLDIDDPLEGPLQINLSLTNATVGTDDGEVQVQSLGGQGLLHSDLLSFNQITGAVLGGRSYADFELRLADQPIPAGTRRRMTDDSPKDASPAEPGRPRPNQGEVLSRRAFSIVAGLQLKELDLQILTRKRKPSNQLIGLLTLDSEAVGVVTRWPKTLTGDGQLQIEHGRLTNLTLVNSLNNAMKLVTRRPQHNDRVNAQFDLTPTGVEISHLNLVTGLLAVRGVGVVGFDESLNLILNGGPLERLQESLGMVGRAFGRVTDRIVRYQVTGSTEDPIIRVRPFGFFTGDPMAEAKAQREADRARYQAERQQRRQAEQTEQVKPNDPASGASNPAPSDDQKTSG
ncbi:MAG: hypothetical protein CBC35_11215 [Planctomycetes bacterium TMED75]|nr:hypothetical protein [Planctomycetaceae bacterium]OUU90719.1 MAG: hypothetical protein CBC35_11215 [Planctomycetes bacterium TMED75]